MKKITLSFALALTILLVGLSVEARTPVLVSYPISEVWPTAVRFLRVDKSYPIREKDDEAGYILFEYTDGNRPAKGSLEFIRTRDRQQRDSTRIVMSIPDQPRHVEQMVLDKLVAKIRDDRGLPAPPPPVKSNPPPPSKDAE